METNPTNFKLDIISRKFSDQSTILLQNTKTNYFCCSNACKQIACTCPHYKNNHSVQGKLNATFTHRWRWSYVANGGRNADNYVGCI